MAEPTTTQTHTPGPWRVKLGKVTPEAETFGFSVVAHGKKPPVCGAGVAVDHVLIIGRDYRHLDYAVEHYTPEEVEANARLIASAPTLLAQRDALLSALKSVAERHPRIGSAYRSLIARVEGAR